MRSHPIATLALAIALATIASATPIFPDDRDAAPLRQFYGSAVDPDRDCQFTLSGGRLTIDVPASFHALARSPVNMNAPRVWRKVAGDFTATARVAFAPTERESLDGAGPMSSAGGLVALSDDDNFATVTRTLEYIDDRIWVSARSMLNGQNNKRTATQSARRDIDGASATAFYVRLQRAGNVVTACAGPDGRQWIELDRSEVAWGGNVLVGVVAENRSARAFEAEFSEFAVTQGAGAGAKGKCKP